VAAPQTYHDRYLVTPLFTDEPTIRRYAVRVAGKVAESIINTQIPLCENNTGSSPYRNHDRESRIHVHRARYEMQALGYAFVIWYRSYANHVERKNCRSGNNLQAYVKTQSRPERANYICREKHVRSIKYRPISQNSLYFIWYLSQIKGKQDTKRSKLITKKTEKTRK
jgi:hypothetical protein